MGLFGLPPVCWGAKELVRKQDDFALSTPFLSLETDEPSLVRHCKDGRQLSVCEGDLQVHFPVLFHVLLDCLHLEEMRSVARPLGFTDSEDLRVFGVLVAEELLREIAFWPKLTLELNQAVAVQSVAFFFREKYTFWFDLRRQVAKRGEVYLLIVVGLLDESAD